MKRFRGLLFAAVLGPVVAAPAAFADSLSFSNTGVAADGTSLTAGASDPHYTLIYSSDGGAYTATATATNAVWVTPTDGAGWISPGASGDQAWNNGYYVYETTIDLTGYDAATAALSGSLAADDGVSIYLNRGGSAVFSGTTSLSSLTPFLINSGFTNGLNEIDFVVVNQSGPTGLLVDDGSLTATSIASETPEPGSFLLVLTGLLVALASRRGGTWRVRWAEWVRTAH